MNSRIRLFVLFAAVLSAALSAVPVSAQPPAPEQIAPVGVWSIDTRPIFHWRASPNSEAYVVIVYDVNTGTKAFETVVAAAVCDVNGECRVRPTDPLKNGGAYGWFIAAFGGGAWGAYTAGMMFNIQTEAQPDAVVPAAFQQLEPMGVFTANTRPTYRWRVPAGAEAFALVVFDIETGRKVVEITFPPDICDVAGLCSARPDVTLQNGRTYGWYVASMRNQQWEPFSAGLPFIVSVSPNPPTIMGSLLNRADNILRVTLIWKPEAGTVFYGVAVYRLPQAEQAVYRRFTPDICTPDECRAEVVLPLRPNETYHFYVAAFNYGGTGGWSMGAF